MNITLPLLKCSGLFLLLQMPAFVSAQTCPNTIPETTHHLIDNYNGTVSDPITGLMWKKCPEGQSYNSITNGCTNTATVFNWNGALLHAGFVNSGFSGERFLFFNWRVPNKKELKSIVERSCINPAINELVFVSPSTPFYWSSSSSAYDNTQAWKVYFGFGSDSADDKVNNSHVRLVRNAQ